MAKQDGGELQAFALIMAVVGILLGFFGATLALGPRSGETGGLALAILAAAMFICASLTGLAGVLSGALRQPKREP